MLFVILCLISTLKAQDEDEIEYDVVETLQSACRCSQILSEVDCKQFCFWVADSDGKTGKCRDRLCSDYTDKSSCNGDEKNLCYFNQESNQCKNLRGDCNSFDTQEQCEAKQNCLWQNQPDDEGVQCQVQEQPEEEIPVICNDINQQEVCDQSTESNSGYQCAWLLNPVEEVSTQTASSNDSTTRLLKVDNTGYCTRFSIKKCTDVNNIDADDSIKEMLCNRFPETCRYTIQTSNGITVTGTNFNLVSYSCEQRTCTDYGTKELCENNYIVPDFEDYLHLCSWTSDSCIEGLVIEKFSPLNSPDNCYKEETRYQLTWNQEINKCTKCPGEGYILSLLFSLYVFAL
ncbi:unnamed protein product (macronuclear) [Paramecium tetraurelia]|uniref:Uncharacterized protein n=1 Tax=Paramecium tetraurelia TaxID=5888 RepID=A0CV51_PARTE|nr:uncharacterized protein GSPATT00010836001 [Paramecium tetraurelia]CAK74668.1 unnamed protein product [Paramecium tetraurelia]|eukprot:XP_001442065.1 hypothetical protein (macronuclear) [Paramecium tetraurelia strain d4-2]